MITQVEKVEIVEATKLPPGRYRGRWSGYKVRLYDHPTIVITVSNGIRGVDVPCVAVVDDQGEACVEIEL